LTSFAAAVEVAFAGAMLVVKFGLSFSVFAPLLVI
jgi:hypothetical protein